MTVINRFRIIADEGKLITNGEYSAMVVDVSEEDLPNWREISVPNEGDIS